MTRHAKNRLTAKQVEAAPDGWYNDGKNLHLRVANGGTSKKWVLRYARDGRITEMGLGGADRVSLKLARELRDKHLANLARGLDPKAERDARSANPVAQRSPTVASHTNDRDVWWWDDILTDDAIMQAWVTGWFGEFVPAGRANWYDRLHHHQKIHGAGLGLEARSPVIMRGARWVRRAIWGHDCYRPDKPSLNRALASIADRYFRRVKHTCPQVQGWPRGQPHLSCVHTFLDRMEAKGFRSAGASLLHGRRLVADQLDDQVWMDGQEVSRLLAKARQIVAAPPEPRAEAPPPPRASIPTPPGYAAKPIRPSCKLSRRVREKAALLAMEELGLDY